MTTWPIVMVTGHRPQHLPPNVRPWVQAELERLALKLRAEHGTTTGISGMALGADLWWVDAVVEAGLKLWAHVPFPQQPTKWRAEDRCEWERLCRRTWRLKTYGGYYDVRTLHERNSGMVAEADAAIAVHDPRKTEGGTASAVRKLVAAGMPIINVNPETQTTTLRDAGKRAA